MVRINSFTAWISSLIALFCLVGILKMILPERKDHTLDLIIGLIILFTISSPLVKLINVDLSDAFSNFSYEYSVETKNFNFEKQILDAAKANMENEISSILKSKYGMNIKKVSIELFTSENNMIVKKITISKEKGGDEDSAVSYLSKQYDCNNILITG